jgi:hypothetical protein
LCQWQGHLWLDRHTGRFGAVDPTQYAGFDALHVVSKLVSISNSLSLDSSGRGGMSVDSGGQFSSSRPISSQLSASRPISSGGGGAASQSRGSVDVRAKVVSVHGLFAAHRAKLLAVFRG